MHLAKEAVVTGLSLSVMTGASVFFMTVLMLAATSVCRCISRNDFLLISKFVDQPTTHYGIAESCNRTDNGKRKSKNRVSGNDTVNTRFWCSNEERSRSTPGCPLFSKRHGCWYHSTRAQWQRNTEQGTIEHGLETFASKIAVIHHAWNKSMHHSCKKESQQKIGRHLIDKI